MFFDFKNVEREFIKFMKTEEMQKIVDKMKLYVIVWEDLDSHMWKDFYQVDGLKEKFKDVKTREEALIILKDYSLPQLSPAEKGHQDENDKEMLIDRAKNDECYEWYIMPHLCQILNGAVTYKFMCHIHPEIKWYYYDGGGHNFVSNVAPDRIRHAVVKTKDVNFGNDVEGDVFCDLYWPEIGLDYLYLDHFKLIEDVDKYLFEQFDF